MDVPRAEAKQAIADLKSWGITTYLLTCDARPATARVVRELGVDSFETALTPDERRGKLRTLVSSRRVAAFGRGSDDTRRWGNKAAAPGRSESEASERDPSVAADDLPRFVEMLRVARHARALVLQNAVGTSIVVVAGTAFAATGVLTPLMAAVVHGGSEVLFILNAIRPPAARSA
jgi:cation transport ATPase